mgnify:CR=1 FL=1
MMCRRLAVVLVVASLGVAGCAKSAKDYYESGNKYAASKKYAEAVVEYRNAVKKDPKFGDAHLKLAETYVQVANLGQALREYVYAADLMPQSKEAQLKAGAFLLLAKRFDDAKARAEKVLKMDPKNLEAQLLLGNAAFGLNDLDGAIRQVEEAIQLAPNSARSYSMLGGLESARGDMAAAEKAFRQAVEIDPKSAPAHLALARFLAGTGRQADAESSFKAAYDIDPKNALAARSLAVFYIVTNRAKEAEPFLKALADDSKDPAPALSLADYYVMMARPDEAVALLKKLAANPDAYVEARLREASIAYGRKMPHDAHIVVDEVLAKRPKNPAALILKARFLGAERKFDEALVNAKAAATADPRSVPAHFVLGGLYAAKNDTGSAVKEYTEVLRLNPRAAPAALELARLQMASGETRPAVQFAEQAVTAAPEDPVARWTLVRTLLASGDLDRAETELKALEAKYPNAAPVVAARGTLQVLRKDTPGARRAYSRALELDPGSNEALAGMVTADMAEKKPSDAKARIEARLAATPSDPAVLLLAARVYATSGDQARAEQALLRTIEVAPENQQAYGLLGQLYLAQGKLAPARERFTELASRQEKPVAAETMIAMILEMEGRRAEAQAHYEKVMTLDPRAPVAANNLAWTYAEAGTNLDMALQLAQTAKAGLPDAPAVDDTLGWVYYKKELMTQALPPLKAAADRDARNPVYQFHLGMALVKSGDVLGGRKSLEQSLRISQSFAGADDARKMLASLQ